MPPVLSEYRPVAEHALKNLSPDLQGSYTAECQLPAVSDTAGAGGVRPVYFSMAGLGDGTAAPARSDLQRLPGRALASLSALPAAEWQSW